jgi:hypothetical protein
MAAFRAHFDGYLCEEIQFVGVKEVTRSLAPKKSSHAQK